MCSRPWSAAPGAGLSTTTRMPRGPGGGAAWAGSGLSKGSSTPNPPSSACAPAGNAGASGPTIAATSAARTVTETSAALARVQVGSRSRARKGASAADPITLLDVAEGTERLLLRRGEGCVPAPDAARFGELLLAVEVAPELGALRGLALEEIRPLPGVGLDPEQLRRREPARVPRVGLDQLPGPACAAPAARCPRGPLRRQASGPSRRARRRARRDRCPASPAGSATPARASSVGATSISRAMPSGVPEGASAAPLLPLEQQRHVHLLVVERVPVPEAAVLVELLAVVGGERDQRVVVQAELSSFASSCAEVPVEVARSRPRRAGASRPRARGPGAGSPRARCRCRCRDARSTGRAGPCSGGTGRSASSLWRSSQSNATPFTTSASW